MTTKLRTGYTTGTCAAAAAKAAAIGLYTGTIPDTVEIETPIGKVLRLATTERTIGSGFAQCAVRKDAGDDPDVTHGCLVFARVERILHQPHSENNGIIIEGGEGVGLVTKPGLQIAPGEPAINPVPRRMITEALRRGVLQYAPTHATSGLKVTISVPDGKKIAKKTFNPRLGIVGGISIIGTTGIVKPMSEAAVKASLVLSLDIAKALGFDSVVLVPGNIGERAVLKWFRLPKEQVVLMSNHVGFMLSEAANKGFKEVLLAGHPGKLAKLIRGDFYTHSSKSRGANDLIIDILSSEKQLNPVIASAAQQSPTVEGIIEILKQHNGLPVFNTIADKIEDAAIRFTNNRLKTGVILFNMKHEIIGISQGSLTWQKNLKTVSQ